jgi:hypothetical protein
MARRILHGLKATDTSHRRFSRSSESNANVLWPGGHGQHQGLTDDEYAAGMRELRAEALQELSVDELEEQLLKRRTEAS